jgi:MFS family permease
MGVKYALMLGLSLYAIGKFVLIFADTRLQLWIVMVTVFPLGISIIYPVLLLGVKRLCFENARPQAFSLFYAAMIIGAILGGPIVDWIRHDYKRTDWRYTHHNQETGEDEERYESFSAWRTICFVGFCLNIFMIIVLCFYRREVEERFEDPNLDKGKFPFILNFYRGN